MTQKEILVFLIDSIFPYESGGRESLIYNYCNKFKDIYEIHIVSGYTKKKEEKYPISKMGIKIYLIPGIISSRVLKTFFPYLPKTLSNFLNSYFVSLMSWDIPTTIFLMYKYYFSHRTVIFMAQNPGLPYFPLIFMNLKRFKRICWVHGNWRGELTPKTPFFYSLYEYAEEITALNAHLIIAIDYNTFNRLGSKYSNIKMLPNGVNFNEMININNNSIDTKLKKFITIGNLEGETDFRGTKKLIKAIPEIISRYKENVLFQFVGAGDQEPYLTLAKELRVENFVEFLGTRKDVPALLGTADFAACLFEANCGMSLASLECMAAGKPIVAWNNNTYTQILRHKYSAFLVDDGNIKELSNGILTLLSDGKLAEFLGKNAQIEAKQYDFDLLSAKLYSYINEISQRLK